MAIHENLKGSITLSFYKLTEEFTLIELKSKHTEYDNVAEAWNAAIEALDRFPQISYAEIQFTPVSGHSRSIEKVMRGPVF